MITPRKKIIPIYLIGTALIVFSYLATYVSHTHAGGTVKISKIELQYAADFSNDRVLVGASHNVFVGKVIREMKTQDLGSGPETQYEVEIVDNIKGHLNGTVAVDQQGGSEDGVTYIVGNDTSLAAYNASNYFLQPGSTYLFATRYNKDQNWYTLNSYPTASKLLSTDSNISDASAKALADSNQRVQQLKAAYPNEILLQADIAHNNTLNSYASVQAAKAQVDQVSAPPPAPEPAPAPTPAPASDTTASDTPAASDSVAQ